MLLLTALLMLLYIEVFENKFIATSLKVFHKELLFVKVPAAPAPRETLIAPVREICLDITKFHNKIY